jgi:hypothetical protein
MFRRRLDDYLCDHEPSVVLKAAVAAVSFASVLVAFFGSPVVRSGAFAAAVFSLMSGVLLLLMDSRGTKQARDRYWRRLNWYYDVLSELSSEPLITVDSWEQRVEIELNGDVREVLTIEAVAPREHVFFARMTARSLWRQPKRQLRGIRMTARSLKADGSRGPSWRIVSGWENDKLISYLDLGPPTHGQVIRFQVERTWPAKCQPLMRGKVESFRLRTTKGMEIRRAEYTVVLPAGFEAVFELVGEAEPDVQLFAVDLNEPDGRQAYKWFADKVPAKTAVGINLQLK